MGTKVKAALIDLLVVFGSAALAIAVAAGANFFDIHSGVWKAAVLAGLVAVVNFAYQYLSKRNTTYGRGSNTGGGGA